MAALVLVWHIGRRRPNGWTLPAVIVAANRGQLLESHHSQLLIDFLHHVGVDLLEVLARADHQRQIGQLRNAARNAVGKLVQSGDGGLGEHGRLAPRLGQWRVDDTLRSRPAATARLRSANRPAPTACSPNFDIPSSRPANTMVNRVRATSRTGPDESLAATLADRLDRRRQTTPRRRVADSGTRSTGRSRPAIAGPSDSVGSRLSPHWAASSQSISAGPTPSRLSGRPAWRGGGVDRQRPLAATTCRCPTGPPGAPAARLVHQKVEPGQRLFVRWALVEELRVEQTPKWGLLQTPMCLIHACRPQRTGLPVYPVLSVRSDRELEGSSGRWPLVGGEPDCPV